MKNNRKALLLFSRELVSSVTFYDIKKKMKDTWISK
jgi:hypothetical protein